MANTSKQVIKKVFNVLLNLVVFAFFVLSIIALVFTISLKKGGESGADLFGHKVLMVLSPSMEQCDKTDVSNYEIKSIKTKSLVFVENIPTDKTTKDIWLKNIKVGDVLTFKYMYSKQQTITHRVVSKTPKDDGFVIVLEGDNKNDSTGVLQQVIDTTNTDSTNYIVGKVTGQSYFLGWIVSVFKSPVGIICIIIVPSVIIILFEIIKMVNIYNKSKRESEQDKKDKEIEELKKQLFIQKQKAKSSDDLNN